MLQSTGEMFYNPYKEYKKSQTAKLSEEAGDGSSGSTPSVNRSNSDPFQTAANMAGATLQGFGKFSATYFRGVIVDIPHAAAEGFRRAPQLYGEKPKEYGTVHDWKSGAIVGGKNFVGGMTTGVTGMIKHPLKGWIEEGPEGAKKGLIKGALGMATNMPSGKSVLSFHENDISSNGLVSSWYWTCGLPVPWYLKKHRISLQNEDTQSYCCCTASRGICSH
jgi:hypothetical protein